jgi:hypothetical protein
VCNNEISNVCVCVVCVCACICVGFFFCQHCQGHCLAVAVLSPSVFIIGVSCLLPSSPHLEGQVQFELLEDLVFSFHPIFCLSVGGVDVRLCRVEMKNKWRQRKPFHFISYLLLFRVRDLFLRHECMYRY